MQLVSRVLKSVEPKANVSTPPYALVKVNVQKRNLTLGRRKPKVNTFRFSQFFAVDECEIKNPHKMQNIATGEAKVMMVVSQIGLQH